MLRPIILALATIISLPSLAQDAHNHHTPSAPPANAVTPEAGHLPEVDLRQQRYYQLYAREAKTTLNGVSIPLYTYNASWPGPLLRVKQNSSLDVQFYNTLAEATTVHWHGLRGDTKNDGVPGLGQTPVAQNEQYRYQLRFPDAGLFWYHPHIREDSQQDRGLYGAILVEPADPALWGKADREQVLILDDLLLDSQGQTVAYGAQEANYALMGRYGNQLFVNGQTKLTLSAQAGETVRYYLLNAANVRPFRLQFGGRPIKLVAGDLGRYQQQTVVNSVDLHPAERLIVDVRYEQAGQYAISLNSPARTAELVQVQVTAETANSLAQPAQADTELARYTRYREQAPDYSLEIALQRSNTPASADNAHAGHTSASVEAKPAADAHAGHTNASAEAKPAADTHAGHTNASAEAKPASGSMMQGMDHRQHMAQMANSSKTENAHAGHTSASAEAKPAADAHAGHNATLAGVEWEDHMPEMNAASTSADTHWILRDVASGKQNMDIHYQFKQNQLVKIRINNPATSDHPMQHPIHFHGQRFLVLSENGQPNSNLVWKDTTNVPAGSSVDILLDPTNPGEWMAHCHIAEHLTSGMMLGFSVEKS